VLQNYNPYEILNGQTPNYSKLHVFGCSCYSFLRPYQSYNLAHKSKQCVFLGYSRNKKRYRCLNLENNRVYISRHLMFDEGMFLAKVKD
jgi:histone deacetylase 1/2